MATFTKSTEMTAQFDSGDIKSMYMSTGKYACYIQISTRNDETAKLSFHNKEDMKKFIDGLMSMAVNLAWDADYDSESTYMGDDAKVTVEQVREWKAVAQAQDVV